MEDNKLLQEILETVNSTFETVNFIKDNAVTKDEFEEFKGEVNKKFDEVNGRFDTLESELRSICIELKDIKFRLAQLEKRTKEDSDAHASDILELRQRVQMLERQVKQLQPAC
ncbi:MAG: hypothetical protein HZC26_01525 [Candidatus Magasanikbacteria bacterium]|nr:hypothetical protein [Candidatus Magasanikbacteria bacterium]